MTETKYDGVTVKAGGRELIVPPLNFRGIKTLAKEIEALGQMKQGQTLTPKEVDTMVKIIHTALKRNYPDMTEDDVADFLDIKNAVTFVNAVMGASGFTQEGETQPGENL